ncbi:MAG TPA: HAD-IA family hydrolase [Micromonosporaceae bacterium]|nr:HAD-IA family hydrolase [Micromonosporaceae bacterium]
MNRRRKPTALLIDFDGVLRRYRIEAQAALEKAAGLAEGDIFALAGAPATLLPALLGQRTRAELRTEVAAQLAGRVGGPAAAEALVETWDAYRGEVVPEVRTTIAELRASGVPVALCTNATDDIRSDLETFELTDAFDAVVASCEIGAVKPMPEFYRAAADAIGVPAHDCLFVDDVERNVAGARNVGMVGFRYSTTADLAYIRAALTV